MLQIDEKYAPLRHGTRAVIRQGGAGLAGQPLRAADAAARAARPATGSATGGGSASTMTTTNVDLDQFFNIFDRPTRKALQDFYKGGQRQYAGRAEAANRGLRYLNPQLAASSRLFARAPPRPAGAGALPGRQLALRDRAVRAPRRPVGADRQPQRHHARAWAARRRRWPRRSSRFPAFMRQANSTYVNLRARAGRPGPARERLEAGGAQAAPVPGRAAAVRPRRGAHGARPAPRPCAARAAPTTCVELQQTYPPLEEMALDRAPPQRRPTAAARSPSCRRRCARARRSSPTAGRTPPTSFGWFDDFSHTGAYDALGSFSRVQTYFNAFTVQNGVPDEPDPAGRPRERCSARWPGCASSSAARAAPRCRRPTAPTCSAPSEQRELDCRESDRATGPTCPDAPAAHAPCWSWPRSPPCWSWCARRRATARARPTRSSSTARFGLVEGGDLKIGGVKAGKTTAFELERKEPYRVVVDARGHRARLRLAAHATPAARCASSR